ncbi:hypothetical protein B0H10DRAFT_1946282 [Mycena sp. CBHHK59/15]|nr:hypothetical protein B0H10DRAFT_1946282 [Mycena sp. CBHHK59/15]
MRFLQRLCSFDPWGTLVFLPAIITLLLALQWGGSKYPWSSAPVIALLVVSGVLSTLFVLIQLCTPQDQATITPRILRQRSIWSSALDVFCMGAAFNIVTFYLPIWSQAIRGVSAVRGARLAHRVPRTRDDPVGDPRRLRHGAAVHAEITSRQTSPLLFEILTGLGVGIGMQQPVLAAQAALELKDVAVGTVVIMFSQTLGGALFVSIGQATFTTILVAGLSSSNSSDPGLSNPAVAHYDLVISTSKFQLASSKTALIHDDFEIQNSIKHFWACSQII